VTAVGCKSSEKTSAAQQLIAVAARRFALECSGDREESQEAPRIPMPSNALSFADEGSPFDLTAVPETIVLAADRSRLRLAWSNGERSELLAGHLRGACRCAWCTRARIDGNFAASFDGITIERLMPIGDYAINVAFSDGHARGIYPWPYLRLLARADRASEMVVGAVAPAVPHDEPLE
jgi:DUF971 family protein